MWRKGSWMGRGMLGAAPLPAAQTMPLQRDVRALSQSGPTSTYHRLLRQTKTPHPSPNVLCSARQAAAAVHHAPPQPDTKRRRLLQEPRACKEAGAWSWSRLLGGACRPRQAAPRPNHAQRTGADVDELRDIPVQTRKRQLCRVDTDAIGVEILDVHVHPAQRRRLLEPAAVGG